MGAGFCRLAGLWLCWFLATAWLTRWMRTFVGLTRQSMLPEANVTANQRFCINAALACFSEAGRWTYDPTPRYIPPNIAGDDETNACDERWRKAKDGAVSGQEANNIARAHVNASAWKVREELKWYWKTNESCPLTPFNREDFCRRVGQGNNVLIVGDSLSQEVMWSLTNHVVINTTGMQLPLKHEQRSFQGWPLCTDVFPHGPGFRIGYIRNDRLSAVQQPIIDTQANFYEWPWIDKLVEWNISLLLLNKGAHYEEGAVFSQSLTDTFAILRSRFPHLLVVYRNTPPGHRDCQSYDRPLADRQDPATLPHQWGQFGRQNQVSKLLTLTAGYIFLDMDAALSLRGDSHLEAGDCLHYCLPGPMDTFPLLFYNLLLLLPH